MPNTQSIRVRDRIVSKMYCFFDFVIALLSKHLLLILYQVIFG